MLAFAFRRVFRLRFLRRTHFLYIQLLATNRLTRKEDRAADTLGGKRTSAVLDCAVNEIKCSNMAATSVAISGNWLRFFPYMEDIYIAQRALDTRMRIISAISFVIVSIRQGRMFCTARAPGFPYCVYTRSTGHKFSSHGACTYIRIV